MKKVISFSLWGNNPTYNIGVIKNAQQSIAYYPDFECWIYLHKDSVPENTITELLSLKHVRIIFKSGDLDNEKCKPRMWRFEPIDDPDVEIVLSRDSDTRIYLREKLAVDEWLQSKTLFHIMRDHPHHNFPILAGMFGTRKLPQIPCWTHLMKAYVKHNNRMYDQDFLKDIIYPIIIHNSIIHASFHKLEKHARPFPVSYNHDYNFVGEYVYHDDSRSMEHVNILKNAAICFH